MKICPKCGKETGNNNKYCEKCGTDLSGEEEGGVSISKIMTMIAGVFAVVLIIGGIMLLISNLHDDPSTNSSTAVTSKPEPETEPHVLPNVLPELLYVYNDHSYGFYNADRLRLNNYADVVDFCRKQGGYLAVINDQAENNNLFIKVRENYAKPAFFGYSDEREEGKCSDFENWTVYGQNQPDNGVEYGGDEDYAEFNYGRGTKCPNDGTWNDAPFRHNTDMFICEWDYDVEEAQR